MKRRETSGLETGLVVSDRASCCGALLSRGALIRTLSPGGGKNALGEGRLEGVRRKEGKGMAEMESGLLILTFSPDGDKDKEKGNR
ncbi:hypothetical protein E2C01_045581 [Portunus trituberculatus]|uniref:Uncharacterized protein n=1 Tax=Portunus trituberculatus TaxID=210409 RepID=A0A5B7G2G3_PORTR|nr:hypothetical protein [Portunus trituberculatus]